MSVTRLPQEIIQMIFEYDLIPHLRTINHPISFDSFTKRALQYTEMDEKTRLRRRTVELALVCRSWRNAGFPKIYNFITVPYCDQRIAKQISDRLRIKTFSAVNGANVRNLYMGASAPNTKHQKALISISRTCPNIHTLTVGAHCRF